MKPLNRRPRRKPSRKLRRQCERNLLQRLPLQDLEQNLKKTVDQSGIRRARSSRGGKS